MDLDYRLATTIQPKPTGYTGSSGWTGFENWSQVTSDHRILCVVEQGQRSLIPASQGHPLSARRSISQGIANDIRG